MILEKGPAQRSPGATGKGLEASARKELSYQETTVGVKDHMPPPTLPCCSLLPGSHCDIKVYFQGTRKVKVQQAVSQSWMESAT